MRTPWQVNNNAILSGDGSPQSVQAMQDMPSSAIRSLLRDVCCACNRGTPSKSGSKCRALAANTPGAPQREYETLPSRASRSATGSRAQVSVRHLRRGFPQHGQGTKGALRDLQREVPYWSRSSATAHLRGSRSQDRTGSGALVPRVQHRDRVATRRSGAGRRSSNLFTSARLTYNPDAYTLAGS